MRESLILAAALAASASLILGCAVTVTPPVVASDVAVEGPVVEGPVVDGGVAIDVEPAMDQRVYVYDAGFPPGVYLYDDYYWYGGYRYGRDAFVNGYVSVNLRGGRFTDVAANRRAGVTIEAQHRAAFASTGGRRPPVAAHAQVKASESVAARPEAVAAHPEPAAAHPEPAAAHPAAAHPPVAAHPAPAPHPAPSGKKK